MMKKKTTLIFRSNITAKALFNECTGNFCSGTVSSVTNMCDFICAAHDMTV